MEQLIWVVCLDRSGSMGRMFSSSTEERERFHGRIEDTSKSVKIDAAKEAILREVQGLDPSSQIAILAFDDTTSLIFTGSAGEFARIKSALAGVESGGQTNIADCLLKCADYSKSFSRVDCLVVTDGLSNVGDPITASRECNRRGVFVNIALIDPTVDGEKIAREIARGARIYAVTSAPELDQGIGLEGIRHQLQNERQARVAFERSLGSTLSELYGSSSDLHRKIVSYEGMLKETHNSFENQLSRLTQTSDSIQGKVYEILGDVRPLLQAFSLGIPVEQAPLCRYVPVRAYLKEGSDMSIEIVTSAIDSILERISFSVAEDFPQEKGSWWKRWTAKSREVLTQPEVQDRLSRIEQAIDLHTLHTPIAKIDKDLSSAVAELIKAVENEPEAALQVGTILILKTKGEDGNSKIMVRTLSPRQLAIIERFPASLKEPSQVLSMLTSELSQEEQEPGYKTGVIITNPSKKSNNNDRN